MAVAAVAVAAAVAAAAVVKGALIPLAGQWRSFGSTLAGKLRDFAGGGDERDKQTRTERNRQVGD